MDSIRYFDQRATRDWASRPEDRRVSPRKPMEPARSDAKTEQTHGRGYLGINV